MPRHIGNARSLRRFPKETMGTIMSSLTAVRGNLHKGSRRIAKVEPTNNGVFCL